MKQNQTSFFLLQILLSLVAISHCMFWRYNEIDRILSVSGLEVSNCHEVGYAAPYIGFETTISLFGNESNKLPLGWSHSNGLDTQCILNIEFDVFSTGLQTADFDYVHLKLPVTCNCNWGIFLSGNSISDFPISCDAEIATFDLNKSGLSSSFRIAIQQTNTNPCGLISIPTSFGENYRLSIHLKDGVIFHPPNISTTQEHVIDWTSSAAVFPITTESRSPSSGSPNSVFHISFILQIMLVVIGILICIGLVVLIALILYFRREKKGSHKLISDEMDEVVAFEKLPSSPKDLPKHHLLTTASSVNDEEETKE